MITKHIFVRMQWKWCVLWMLPSRECDEPQDFVCFFLWPVHSVLIALSGIATSEFYSTVVKNIFMKTDMFASSGVLWAKRSNKGATVLFIRELDFWRLLPVNQQREKNYFLGFFFLSVNLSNFRARYRCHNLTVFFSFFYLLLLFFLWSSTFHNLIVWEKTFSLVKTWTFTCRQMCLFLFLMLARCESSGEQFTRRKIACL